MTRLAFAGKCGGLGAKRILSVAPALSTPARPTAPKPAPMVFRIHGDSYQFTNKNSFDVKRLAHIGSNRPRARIRFRA